MIVIIVIKLNRIGQLVNVDKQICKLICLTYLHNKLGEVWSSEWDVIYINKRKRFTTECIEL